MLKTRLLTALILIPLVLALILLASATTLAILGLLLVAIGAWEWAGLAGLATSCERTSYIVVTLLVSLATLLLPLTEVLMAAALWWLAASYWVMRYPHAPCWSKNKWLKAVVGTLVLAFCWIGLLVVRQQTQGAAYLLLLLATIWAADTGAYFAGRRWGKHKLAPAVSPGKTWQGLVGGLGLALLVAALGSLGLDLPAERWPWWLGWIALTVLVSVCGDLFESLVKRQAGVKDSGQLLPGHGGLLDRIDSLTAALPLFALGILLII